MKVNLEALNQNWCEDRSVDHGMVHKQQKAALTTVLATTEPARWRAEMKYVFLGLFMMIAVLTSPISGYAQGKVPAKLWQEVQSTGTVRILVMFDLNQESLRNLSREDQIAVAQDMLLAELFGTKFRVNGRFRYVTGMGLSVDAEGLSIIERSPLVDKVNESIAYRVL